MLNTIEKLIIEGQMQLIKSKAANKQAAETRQKLYGVRPLNKENFTGQEPSFYKLSQRHAASA